MDETRYVEVTIAQALSLLSDLCGQAEEQARDDIRAALGETFDSIVEAAANQKLKADDVGYKHLVNIDGLNRLLADAETTSQRKKGANENAETPANE